jgi:hypothetical protein
MAEDDVIDLHERRSQREQQVGAEAHARGQAFAFAPYDFDETFVGHIETNDNRTVVLITDPTQLVGICMTPEDAVKLGAALVAAGKVE